MQIPAFSTLWRRSASRHPDSKAALTYQTIIYSPACPRVQLKELDTVNAFVYPVIHVAAISVYISVPVGLKS